MKARTLLAVAVALALGLAWALWSPADGGQASAANQSAGSAKHDRDLPSELQAEEPALSRALAALNVRVLSEEGRPVAGARVTLTPRVGDIEFDFGNLLLPEGIVEAISTQKTSDEGLATFILRSEEAPVLATALNTLLDELVELVVDVRLEVRVRARGFLPSAGTFVRGQDVLLGPGNPITKDVVLSRGRVLRGDVVDAASGHPIEDAELFVVAPDSGRRLTQGVTNANGAFIQLIQPNDTATALDGLGGFEQDVERVLIHVLAKNYAICEALVLLPTDRVSIRIDRGTPFQSRLVDAETSAPVTGEVTYAEVVQLGPGSRRHYHHREAYAADEQGGISFPTRDETTAGLTIKVQGYNRVTVNPEHAEPGTENVIDLFPSRIFGLSFFDEDGVQIRKGVHLVLHVVFVREDGTEKSVHTNFVDTDMLGNPIVGTDPFDFDTSKGLFNGICRLQTGNIRSIALSSVSVEGHDVALFPLNAPGPGKAVDLPRVILPEEGVPREEALRLSFRVEIP